MVYLIFKMVLAFAAGIVFGGSLLTSWKTLLVGVVCWTVFSFALDVFVHPLFK